MYRFFIVDNGLDKISGHHYNQTLGLIHGAKELGYQPIAYCGKISSAIPEILAIATPTFNKILYRPDPFINIKENALSFAQECDHCIPELDETDILCFPNVNFDEIQGIAHLIKKRKITQKIIVRLLYYPHQHETEYLDCLNTLKHHANVKLVTSSIPYSKWLKEEGIDNHWIGGPPHKLPYQVIDNNPDEYQYEFASLGAAAEGKGFVVLIKALLLGLSQGYAPRTLLHTKGFVIPPDLIAKLSHVTFVPESVSEEVFYEQLGDSKCLITYYHPGFYRLQDSAIVTEALALGRYILCSPIAFIFETYGDEFFQFSCTPGEYSEQALLKKMQAISAQTKKPDCVLAAGQQAKLLSSPTIFVAKLLAL